MTYSVTKKISSLIPLLYRFLVATTLLLLFIACLIPVSAHSEKSFFSIHLDTFEDAEKAEERVNSLKLLGHNAFFRQDEKGSYRVLIEKYGSRDESEHEAEGIKKIRSHFRLHHSRTEGGTSHRQ